jgi:hypothetical protein
MLRWSAFLLIFSLIFPFLLKNGVLLQFHNSSIFARQTNCQQIKIITCAGKCQLVKVMKKLPSNAHDSSLPFGVEKELSPFDCPKSVEEDDVPFLCIEKKIIHITAQTHMGYPFPMERPPCFSIV